MTNKRKVQFKSAKPRKAASAQEVREIQSAIQKLKVKQNTPFKDVGGHLGGLLGSFLGSAELGRGFGKTAGSFIGKILGSGDYKTNFDQIKNNSFITAGPPGFGGGATVTMFTHREYICDILSSATTNNFKVQSFPINPAQEASYPWLSTIAQNFEEYQIVGQIYEFRSTSSDALNSTNTALGTVILATQYDPTKPPFASKFEMENYEFAVSVKPSQSVMHAVECKNDLTPVTRLYTRSGTQAVNADLRWSDFGNFCIASTGMQASSVLIGELWVSYQIKCFKPRIPQTVGGNLYSNHTIRTGAVSTNPIGLSTIQSVGSLPITVGSTSILWTVQYDTQWLVTIIWTGSSASGLGAPAITFANCKRKDSPAGFNNQSMQDLTCTGASTGSTLSYSTIVVPTTISGGMTPINMTMTFNTAGVFPAGTVITDIYITQLDSSVNQ